MLNSICLIGKAEKTTEHGVLLQLSSTEKAKSIYGENCELYNIFSKIIMYDTINIYTISVFTNEDYIKAIKLLQQYDIDYICPIDIFIDDNIWYNGNKISKLRLLLENLNDNSSVIATYHHASKFLDMDDYIVKVESSLEAFQKQCYDFIRRKGDSFIFCMNTLKEYNAANVLLAIALLTSPLGTYPQIDIGEIIFPMNSPDIFNKSVYFRKNFNIPNSIENLINHMPNNDPIQFEEIRIVKKYIEYRIRECGLKGKAFNYKVTRDTVFSTMKEIKDKNYIKDFYIDNISYVTTNSVDVLIEMTIVPISTFESYKIRLEV